VVRECVCRARERQIERSGKPNSQLNNRELQRYCHLESEAIQMPHLAEAISYRRLEQRVGH
jgi:predicted ATPase with chaperone activity